MAGEVENAGAIHDRFQRPGGLGILIRQIRQTNRNQDQTMSDFRFACPSCGQRIACDSSLRGAQITCPNCQNPLTVPAPAAKAAIGDPADPSSTRSRVRPGAAKISGLAIASLVCGCVPVIGSIPGIICGHLARKRIQSDPALLGKGMALAGLIASYITLTGAIVFYTPKLYARTQVTTVIRREADVREVMRARGVDEVKIGDTESESAHNLKGLITGAG